MNSFRLKYYPPNVLIALLLLTAVVCIAINQLSSLIVPQLQPLWANMLGLFLGFVSIGSILAMINRYGFRLLHRFLDIPDLNGNYRGDLISSYHVDDLPQNPHITKWVEMTISQNLNGLSIRATFYDSFSDREKSSTSINISDDITAMGDGRYEIVYRYRSEGKASHPHHDRHTLNNHEGLAVLLYSPADQTLEGHYYNNSKERPSHGDMKLIKY